MTIGVNPVELTFDRADRFFIGGSWVRPFSSDCFNVLEASSEDFLFRVAEARKEDISAAAAAARQAFDSGPWPHMSHQERAGYLRKIGTAVARRHSELARVQSGQMGLLYSDALASALRDAAAWNYYADLADSFEWIEHHRPSVQSGVGLLVREPVGVVAAIIPWNGPSTLITYKTAPALLAGCTVVLKASPESPGEAYIFAEIAEEVNLPPGVFNVITADRPVSELLVRDPRVDKVTFTGSTAAGRRIASICGERVARYNLELGGKSAALVLDDYDIETAAAQVVAQECFMTGQACASLTRVIVDKRRHDEMADALRDGFGAVRVGSPYDPGVQMGPLATERQRGRVEGYIAKGIEEGAALVAGGKRPQGLDKGYFIEPTVFASVSNSWTIAHEEIFGPVISVIPADTEQAAIAIANDTIYGLNNSVFTKDVDRAYRVARQLRSGTVGHNASGPDWGIAFGGFKQSGTGREGGVEGLRPFLEAKTVMLESEPRLQERLAIVGYLAR